MNVSNLMSAFGLALAIAACAPANTTGATEPGESAFQTERVHEAGRVKIWVPPSWHVDDKTADTLIMDAPDGTVSIGMTVVDGQDLGAALLGVAANTVIGFEELTLIGEPVSAQLNGMDALFQDARGRYQGRAVDVSVGVIDTPADKYLLVFGEAATGQFAQHEPTLQRVLDGIRPL